MSATHKFRWEVSERLEEWEQIDSGLCRDVADSKQAAWDTIVNYLLPHLEWSGKPEIRKALAEGYWEQVFQMTQEQAKQQTPATVFSIEAVTLKNGRHFRIIIECLGQ